MPASPRVKICCIQSVEEVRLAVECGAAALGFVSSMPSGPGVIDEPTIARLAAAVPPPVGTFLLTCRCRAGEIVEQQRRCRTNAVQLCDEVPLAVYGELRRALPGIALVQVIHVTGEGAVLRAREVAPFVDALLLDSGDPRAPVKELGGTARVHDWGISRRIRAEASKPIFLAGGLTGRNVAQAVHEVEPFAVDVCSGVRRENRLDRNELHGFFAALMGSTSMGSTSRGEGIGV